MFVQLLRMVFSPPLRSTNIQSPDVCTQLLRAVFSNAIGQSGCAEAAQQLNHDMIAALDVYLLDGNIIARSEGQCDVWQLVKVICLNNLED